MKPPKSPRQFNSTLPARTARLASSKSPARAPMTRKRRPKSETLRIYGDEDRRAWIKSLPCAGCGVVGFSENAHVCGNAGAGRKANADTIAPLCRDRPGVTGCHTLYDQHKRPFVSEASRRRIRAEAYSRAREWRDMQRGAA